MSATRAAVGTSARHSFVYTNITPLRASLFLRVLLAPTRSPRLIKALAVRGWRHFAGAASRPVRDSFWPACIRQEPFLSPGLIAPIHWSVAFHRRITEDRVTRGCCGVRLLFYNQKRAPFRLIPCPVLE